MKHAMGLPMATTTNGHPGPEFKDTWSGLLIGKVAKVNVRVGSPVDFFSKLDLILKRKGVSFCFESFCDCIF